MDPPRRARVTTAVAVGLILWAALPGSARAAGQARSAELAGVARDPDGAAVPGVTVTLVEQRSGAARMTITNREGQYAFAALEPGRYTVSAALSGFRPFAGESLDLGAGARVGLDILLEIGDLRETITVTGLAPLLRVASSSLRQAVTRPEVTALPLSGRSFVSLVALAPGVALPPGSAFPRINGGRPRANEYLFDGISVLQPEPGQVPFVTILDAIDELEVETNSPPAQFGRFNGGVISLTTRAGSDDLRGTAFGFGRHEALGARNVFAPRTPSNPEKPRFRRRQLGATLGGPLRRGRTFFFGAYQGTAQDLARVRISTVPTLLQRQGLFTEPIGGRPPLIYDPSTTTALPGGGFSRAGFPGNAIPEDRIDPVARRLIERYPLPTSAGTANNYRREGVEAHDAHQFDVRLDGRVGEGSRAFVRYSDAREAAVPVAPLPDGSGSLAGLIGDTRTHGANVVGSYVRLLGRRAVNDLRAGYTRWRVARRAARLSDPAAPDPAVPGLPPGARFQDTLPTFAIDGYQQLGAVAGANTDLRTDVTQLLNVLTLDRGRHSIKLGLDWRWQRLDVIQPPSPTGSFRFTSLFTDLPGTTGTGSPLASFLLGQVDSFSIDVQERVLRPRARSQEYFVQDDWRLHDRLTLNAGLRYTLNFPSTEADDQGAVFNLETQRLDYLGRHGFPRSARRLHKDHLGPRLGVAWQVGASSAVRAAYGLVWFEMAGITTPFINPQFPFVQALAGRSLDGVMPAFVLAGGPGVAPLPPGPDAGLGQGVFTVDRDLASGYAQQWNVAWQRTLGRGVSVEAAYVGSTITRLGVPDTNINQLTVDQLALGPALLEPVPNPYYGEIPASSPVGGPTVPLAQLLRPFPRFTTVSFYRHNVGRSHYHGGTLRLEKRFSAGLSLRAGYTRSRLVDDASSVFDATVLTGPVASYPVADSFNRRLERDVYNGDIPHAVTAAVVWEVPLGRRRRYAPAGWIGRLTSDWELAAVVTLQSGTPLSVTQATNFNAFAGFGTQRPDLIGDPALPASERTVTRWFNTAAFRTAPPFALGTSTRNPVRGPAYRNVDLALVRRVPVREVALELRAEAFNALNTLALGSPNTVLGTPGFGSITSAGDPRVVQLGIRLHF